VAAVVQVLVVVVEQVVFYVVLQFQSLDQSQ
jgi:hypothetical protein